MADQETHNLASNWKEFSKSFQQYIGDVLDLDKGVDKRGTIEEIRLQKSMAGANAWMLMCSIMIASIGLSQGSAAVIIGAMLISPLMSPILGIGTAVGINDRKMLIRSFNHLGIAVIITLVTSTLYFFFTPFGEITPEIEARTSPTFLDIIIAIFGGVAGIVSHARKDISTTLPGVAIATALMPPLCVTGFGIANANWTIAFTSFYLFFLNTFFVSLATYFIVKLLKFPLNEYASKAERLRNKRTLVIFSIAAIIPSLLIFKNVLNDVRTEKNMDIFIAEYIGDDEIYLDQHKMYESDSSNLLVLKVYGNVINPSRIQEYNEGLTKLGFVNTEVQIIQSSEVDISDVASLESKIDGIEKIATQLNISNQQKEEYQVIISNYKNITIDSALFVGVTEEIQAIFPNIEEIGLSKVQKSDFTSYRKNVPLALVKWDNTIRSTDKKIEQGKLEQFLIHRLDLDSLTVVAL